MFFVCFSFPFLFFFFLFLRSNSKDSNFIKGQIYGNKRWRDALRDDASTGWLVNVTRKCTNDPLFLRSPSLYVHVELAWVKKHSWISFFHANGYGNKVKRGRTIRTVESRHRPRFVRVSRVDRPVERTVCSR